MSATFQPGPRSRSSIPKKTTTGFGALVALTTLGGLSSGFPGAAVFFGLTLFGTGLWHFVSGRSWLAPLLPQGREVGLALLISGVVIMGVGTTGASTPYSADGPVSAIPSPSPVSSTAVPKPAPVPPSSPATSVATKDGTALAALAQLDVKGRAPKTGYAREEFGQKWADVDRNGCDTRNDILRRDLTDVRTTPGSQGCAVMTGTLQDPFTGDAMQFVRGTQTSGQIHIDHVVALSDAWQKGAQQWTPEQRTDFANDPLNLLAVQGVANQQKGDGDAATWLPANKAFRCKYVSQQIAVKSTYDVWVTQAEHDAMEDILRGCPDELLPRHMEPPSTADSIAVAATTTTEPAAPPVTTAAAVEPVPSAPAVVTTDPAPPAPEPTPEAVFYKNCTAVRDAGAAPILRGEPGYSPRLDGDGDGIGCE